MPAGEYTGKVNEEYVRELTSERSKVPELVALKSSTDFQNLPKPEFPIVLYIYLRKQNL